MAEYTHKPNNLISFLKYQCKLGGDNIIIPSTEQDFLYKVNSSEEIIFRSAARRSGGSTLLSLIGAYFILCGKTVALVTKNRWPMESLEIIGYTGNFPTKDTFMLENTHGRTKKITFYHSKSDIVMAGRSVDVVLIDNAPSKILPVAIMAQSRKCVVNVSPESDM